MSYAGWVSIFLFAAGLVGIWQLLPKSFSLTKRVFSAFVLGIALGLLLNNLGQNESDLKILASWVNLVAVGYVRLLEMLLMPLVFTFILSAIARLVDTRSLGKMSVVTLGFLLVTTFISALVGIIVTAFFKLTASGLVAGTREINRLEVLEQRITKVQDLSVPDLLLSFFPHNPLVDLSGTYPTSVISVVIIAALFGFAALHLHRDKPEMGQKLLAAIEVFRLWIMKLVQIVIALTPYGVFALIINLALTSKLEETAKLLIFIVASYVAIIIMFLIHALFLMMVGLSPLKYFKKVFTVLLFSFGSRSSAAAIPLNAETQRRELGVPADVASFSASIGATIGQNGCAGVYPAMLATMIAPTMGVDIWEPSFFLGLSFIVMLSSFGIAGVGGGAVFSALMVLPLMGFPITLVALLISIEPIIDMGRTALNVNGAMTAGVVTARTMKKLDIENYNR